jgi:nitrate/nitrite transport system permease protein
VGRPKKQHTTMIKVNNVNDINKREIPEEIRENGASVSAPKLPRVFPWKTIGNGLGSLLLGLFGFGLLLLIWHLIASKGEDLPGPLKTLPVLWSMLKNPFYENGENDKGIGIQLVMSLGRVFKGFGIGALIAIPLGILMGAVPFLFRIFNPVIQILRPVSPLAWYPIGLAVLKDSPQAVTFAIVITSLWPTLINTMVGVSGVPQDFRNVARVFRFSPPKYIFRVLLPYALPHILTGLRLSMGIAWVVIVAGEMLAGGTGIGYFVWDSYNGGSIEKVLSAILIIGAIGLLLDRAFEGLTHLAKYKA